MKLLFDENLSPRLVGLLADIYPASVHVHSCGLGSANDTEVWQYAAQREYTIVSKDSDFQERSIVLGFPPKVIWIRAVNCSTGVIEDLLRQARSTLERFFQDEHESCLILAVRSPNR